MTDVQVERACRKTLHLESEYKKLNKKRMDFTSIITLVSSIYCPNNIIEYSNQMRKTSKLLTCPLQSSNIENARKKYYLSAYQLHFLQFVVDRHQSRKLYLCAWSLKQLLESRV